MREGRALLHNTSLFGTCFQAPTIHRGPRRQYLTQTIPCPNSITPRPQPFVETVFKPLFCAPITSRATGLSKSGTAKKADRKVTQRMASCSLLQFTPAQLPLARRDKAFVRARGVSRMHGMPCLRCEARTCREPKKHIRKGSVPLRHSKRNLPDRRSHPHMWIHWKPDESSLPRPSQTLQLRSPWHHQTLATTAVPWCCFLRSSGRWCQPQQVGNMCHPLATLSVLTHPSQQNSLSRTMHEMQVQWDPNT